MPHVSTPRGRGARLRPGTERNVPHKHRPQEHGAVRPSQPPESRPAESQTIRDQAAGGRPSERRVRRLGRRPVLDGLRGIAVMLVISEHTSLLPNGFMGVDVFFILSGFLITTLLCEEWERHGRVSLKSFYTRRARRLLPALGVLALMAIIANYCCWTLTGWGLGLKLLSTFGFANNWVAGLGLDGGKALGALNPTWSLAQEDQFYLLWPLGLIVMYRIGLRPRQMLALLAAAIAALLLIEPTFAAHLTNYSTYYDPVDRAAELLLGCAGALIWHNRLIWLPEAGDGPAGLAPGRSGGSRLAGWSVRAGTELALVGLAFAFAWLAWRVHPGDSRWVFLAAAGITLPGLLLVVQVPRSLIGRLISAPPLRWVGRVSYGLYLIHMLIRNALALYWPQLTRLEMAGITVAAGLALATLSYRYIEKPILAGRWPLGLGGLPARLAGAVAHPNRPATTVRRRTVRSTA